MPDRYPGRRDLVVGGPISDGGYRYAPSMGDQESTAAPSDRETNGIGLGDELNRDFYAHSPSQYLRTRITLLIAFGDARTPIHQAVSEGVSAWDMSANSDAAPDDDETDGFAVVESLSIMYLAAEALLRLYFAHALPSIGVVVVD